MKSRIFSFDMVRNSSKKQLWIPAFLFLAYFLAFPLAELLRLDDWEMLHYTDGQIRLLVENLWKDGFLFTGYVVTCAAAVINGVQGFCYLYSSGKVDFYHSLPIKRTEMFFHKIWVGLCYTAVPYVFMVFAAICLEVLKGYFSPGIVGFAIIMMAVHLLLYLLIYFAVVLAILITGKYLPGVMTAGILFFYGPAAAQIIEEYRDIFYDTAVRGYRYGLLRALSDYLSPVFLGATFLRDYTEHRPVFSLAAVVLAAALLGGLCLFLYKKRPSESTGIPVIFKAVSKILKYAVVVFCGLAAGMIFYSLPNASSDSRKLWWCCGLIFGTIFSHGMMEVLYQGEFRKFFSEKRDLAAVGALVLLCSLWYRFDAAKFDEYLPKNEEIQAFYMAENRLDYNAAIQVSKNSDGTYTVSSDWEREGSSLIPKGEQMGEEMYALLKEIVSSQEDTRGQSSREYKSVCSLPVKYILSSGRAVYREYVLTTDQVRSLMLTALRGGRLKEQIYSFLCLGRECLGQSVTGDFVSGQYTLLKNQPDKYEELMEAFREDVEEATEEELLEQPAAELFMSFEIPCLKGVDRMVPGQEVGTSNIQICVGVVPAFKRTIAFIESMGYGDKLGCEDVKSVRVIYEWPEKGEESQPREDLFEDPQQLEELRACLVPGMLNRSWISYEERAAADGILENGTEAYFSLLKDKIPDFLSQRIQEEISSSNEGEEELEIIE